MRDSEASSVGATVRLLDVVATGRKQADHARQRAGLVCEQQSDDVFHVVEARSSDRRR